MLMDDTLMTDAIEKEALLASKTSTFSAYRKLLKVSLEYFRENVRPFHGCLVVGMQHMLGTTVDMFRVMKRLGLEQAVVGSKLAGNHVLGYRIWGHGPCSCKRTQSGSLSNKYL